MEKHEKDFVEEVEEVTVDENQETSDPKDHFIRNAIVTLGCVLVVILALFLAGNKLLPLLPSANVDFEQSQSQGSMLWDETERHEAPEAPNARTGVDDFFAQTEDAEGSLDTVVTRFIEGWELGKMVSEGVTLQGPAIVQEGSGVGRYIPVGEKYTLDRDKVAWLYESSDEKMRGEFIFFDVMYDKEGKNVLFKK